MKGLVSRCISCYLCATVSKMEIVDERGTFHFGDNQQGGMIMITSNCEFCGKETLNIKKTMVMTSVNKLEDFILCVNCIENISDALVAAEINAVKELRRNAE